MEEKEGEAVHFLELPGQGLGAGVTAYMALYGVERHKPGEHGEKERVAGFQRALRQQREQFEEKKGNR